MIIVGYQGIGKSTLGGKYNYIDLESSNFYLKDGTRPDNWFVFYCNIADDLSRQGYTVFVSSHAVVRKRLKKYSKENVIAIVPSLGLKDYWIDKLKLRYKNTNLDKDLKAYMNSVDRYEENIAEIKNDCKTFIIKEMDYDLKTFIDQIKVENKE